MSLDMREFDKALNEYMKFQKRSIADVINAKLYYIARNATMTTKATTSTRIDSELKGGSRNYPEAPLAAILINKQLGSAGKKGLTGAKMSKAVEKFIKKRQASRNFIRAGWKNAIVILEKYLKVQGEYNFVRRWMASSPVDKDTMKKKGKFENLGKAIPAKITSSPRAWGEIENSVHGKDPSESLDRVKVEGLQKAINMEVRSMITYLERKLNPVHSEFNRKQGF